MKSSPVRHLFSALALLGLGASLARADFISPSVSGPERVARAAAAPAGLVSVLTVINNRDDGPGSLRQAIASAAPGDLIQFALPLPATIALKSSLTIARDLIIVGPGPQKLTVARASGRRTPSFRVFNVDAGKVTLAGMSILNGRALNPDGVSDNLGGGILSFGSLTVSNCVVSQNEAPTENNGVGYGGGIFAVGPLKVLDSTVSQNKVSGAGGGISTFHSSDFVMEGSTVSDNFAAVQGGGVNFQGAIGSIKNCTISGNKIGTNGAGSGLLNLVFPGEASGLAISECTITRNKGGTNAVVLAALPGSIVNLTWMIGTLVADNETRNFSFVGTPVFQSFGHNLDTDGTSGLVNGVLGDLVGTLASPIDARLGALLANGGPTRTHALLFGSPAVDAGVCADVAGGVLVIDQRGFPRPQGLACDIGAFENQPPTITCPTNITVECGTELKATVNDPDGDALAVVWRVDGLDVQTNFLSALHPPAPRSVKLKASLSSGAHTISLRVSDGKAAVVACASSVTGTDAKPPQIGDLKADPRTLSPVRRQFVPVTVTVRATDCGPFQCRIVSVQSSEPVGAEPDWIITGDLTLQLRAEQDGNRGRIYTITVECRDSAGNTSRKSVTVTVGKDSSDDHESHSGPGSGPDDGPNSGSQPGSQL